MKKLLWLALAGAALAPAAAAHAQTTSPGPGLLRVCDPSACITYWWTGGSWVIIDVQPVIPGERNVD